MSFTQISNVDAYRFAKLNQRINTAIESANEAVQDARGNQKLAGTDRHGAFRAAKGSRQTISFAFSGGRPSRALSPRDR
jgi:hypothetical protein